jgi:hypothetical protein
MNESCASCMFFWKKGSEARCRRYPPHLQFTFHHQMPVVGIKGGMTATEMRMQYDVPPVAEHHWCGEYRERVEWPEKAPDVQT